MAQQFDGWNLGLHPLNARIRMARNRNNSMSFSTVHYSASPSTSSSDSSSNLDTDESGSFFHDNGITFGSLIGVSSVLELYRRSLRRAKTEVLLKRKKVKKSISSLWFLCLCLRSSNPDAENNPPSLGQYLALERRAANENRKDQMALTCGHDDDFALAQTIIEPNSLFVNNGTIAPPGFISSRQSVGTERESRDLWQGKNWFGSLSKVFSCLCGQATRG